MSLNTTPSLIEGIQRLEQSIEKCQHIPSTRFFQLATVDSKGKPENRTVVFRGLEHEPLAIALVSDINSRKVDAIGNCSTVSLCWYFEPNREQFVIEGEAQVFGQDGDATSQHWCNAYWQRLSPNAKAEYYSIVLQRNEPEPSIIENIHPSFCVIAIAPICIRYLNLTTQPNTSIVFD